MLPEAEALSVQLKSKHELRKKTFRKQSVSFYSVLSFRVESLQFQFVSNFDQIKVQNRYYEKLRNQKIFGHPMRMALTAEK